MLLNQGTIWALDAVFVTMLQQANRKNYIATDAEFFEFFFRVDIVNRISRLKICQSV